MDGNILSICPIMNLSQGMNLRPTGIQLEYMEARHSPSPPGGGHGFGHLRGVISFKVYHHVFGWEGGVQINGNAPECFVIVEAAVDVPVSECVHEAKLFHTPG